LTQEELEKTKTNLQLKEVAVEGLRLIAQEQTAKIKDLEKELEDAQHALFQVLENEDWKTCQRQTTDNSKYFATTGKKVQSDDDDKDGCTLFLGKRQSSPSKKQTKTNNAQSGSISQLCETDCSDSPCVDKQFSGQSTSSDAEIQSSSASSISFDCVSQTSSEDGYVGCGESSLVGEADGLRGDQQNGPGSVRRPPGLNTEPVPEGQMPKQQKLRPSWSTGKFSSFDKLMVALQERFPSKNRQELIALLKKAKAHSGAAGFKGMQIPDVVKCVEDIVETEVFRTSY